MAYYLALPFIYLVALLPFRLLYLLSDAVFVVIYYLVGYRKKVVAQNLANAFPAMTPQDRDALRRKYYRYFCDLFLETFKTLTVSRRSMLRHCHLTPGAKQLFDALAAENKSSIIVMGHYGNWEWGGNAFSLECRQPLYVIYRPLSSRGFDRLMYTMRSRFGTRLIAMKDAYRDMAANRGEVNTTAFIADQTPAPEQAFWTTFLNQDTPVFRGTEKIAVRMNVPVVYVGIHRERRGYYSLDAEVLCREPATTAAGEISEMHTRRLEQDILQRPEFWLWSHRRWKHRRPGQA
jgi:KDO2-lipid IV(A) lauroyltransferase